MADSERTFRLTDGRDLEYAEQGDLAGKPILLFHGLPGSRLTRHPDGSIARVLGVRVYTFDRPGIGRSTFKPRRRILDWPGDVEEFVDAHGVERFAVLGWSGGTPYALAVAHALPKRVIRVGLVCPVTPLAGSALVRNLSPELRRRVRLGRVVPWAVRVLAVREARLFARDPEAALDRAFAGAPACDRVVLEDPELRQMQIESRREAYRQPAGLALDALLYSRPWGLDPAAVRVPTLLWHGDEDTVLAPELGRRLARMLPDCRATFVPGEGHMLCITRWGEILRELAHDA